MRTYWVVASGVMAGSVALLACGSDTTSPGKTCGSSAAAANISATSSKSFAPSAARIAVGQSVCWQNQSQFDHTVTSDDGSSFNSGLAIGETFVHTFAAVGTYTYHCTIHAGMVGTITVQ